MWSEMKPIGTTTTLSTWARSTEEIESQISGSSHGIDGGPLRLCQTTDHVGISGEVALLRAEPTRSATRPAALVICFS